MANNTLNIELQPKQRRLLELVEGTQYENIGYGGSAGGAKSHAIRDINLICCLKYPKLNTLIFRRLSNDLLENHIIPFFAKYPELRQYFNKSEKIIYFPNGSTTRFGYAETEDDIYDFQGKEYGLQFIDEATHSTKNMIEFLKTRNRDTSGNIRAKQILTANPGGVGHAYIKRLFIDKIYLDNEDPNDYIFIHAKIYDNVMWSMPALKEQGLTAQDYYSWNDQQKKNFTYKFSNYARTLLKLPTELREAFLEGNWEIFGGMFFKSFDFKGQVIEPFEIPSGWQLIGSLDPARGGICSFGLTAKDYEGKIYRIGTLYQPGQNMLENAKGVNDFIFSEDSPIYPYTKSRRPSIIVSGLDAWAKVDRHAIFATEITYSDIFARNYNLPLTKAVTPRVQGWWAWKALFPNKYMVFDKLNEELLTEMREVSFDKKYSEDIQGRGNDNNVKDHALDEARYSIMSLFKPFKEPEPDPNITRPFMLEMQSELKSTSF